VTVAGEIDIGSLNGSSAIAAALQSADFKIIGNSGTKWFFTLRAAGNQKRRGTKMQKDRHDPIRFGAGYLDSLRA
jgi:hypothetical protein